MPLASPSFLTSNTLAAFLDHVPISTNNAEKWKPKQMGSNSGWDYWALSRALSAPPGHWEVNLIPSFSQHGNRGRRWKKLLQYVYIYQTNYTERFKWSLEYILDLKNSLILAFLCIFMNDKILFVTIPLYKQCPKVCINCGISWK